MNLRDNLNNLAIRVTAKPGIITIGNKFQFTVKVINVEENEVEFTDTNTLYVKIKDTPLFDLSLYDQNATSYTQIGSVNNNRWEYKGKVDGYHLFKSNKSIFNPYETSSFGFELESLGVNNNYDLVVELYNNNEDSGLTKIDKETLSFK